MFFVKASFSPALPSLIRFSSSKTEAGRFTFSCGKNGEQPDFLRSPGDIAWMRCGKTPGGIPAGSVARFAAPHPGTRRRDAGSSCRPGRGCVTV